MFVIRPPAWWLLLLFVATEAGFLAAARWQWQRGEMKDRRDCEFAQALADQDPQAIADFSTLSRAAGDFARVHVRGKLLTRHVYLHDNRIVDGLYGVDVYAPLAIDGGHVLVNLGWIAADRSRRVAPAVPNLPESFDAQGLLAPAPAIGFMQGQEAPARAATTMRLNIDPAMIGAELKLAPMLDRVFWPVAESGSGFRRHWRPPGLSADRHRGYALQWSSFAVVLLLMFLMFHVRRKEVRQ